MDTLGSCDGFIEIYRFKKGKFELVITTEVVKNTLNPRWEPVILKANKFMREEDENGEFPVLIKCFDWNRSGQMDYMGKISTNYKLIRMGNNSKFELINEEDSNKSYGFIVVESVKAIQTKTGGKEIGLTRAPTMRGNSIQIKQGESILTNTEAEITTDAEKRNREKLKKSESKSKLNSENPMEKSRRRKTKRNSMKMSLNSVQDFNSEME